MPQVVEDFDPLDYAAFPDDAEPELVFAPEEAIGIQSEAFRLLAAVVTYSFVGLVFIELFLQPSMLMAFVGLGGGLWVFVYFASLFATHNIEYRSLDMRLSQDACESLREHAPRAMPVRVLLILACGYAVVALLFLAADKLGFAPILYAPVIALAAVIVLAAFAYRSWKRNESETRTLWLLSDACVTWFQPDYPPDVPNAFSPVDRDETKRKLLCFVSSGVVLGSLAHVMFFAPLVYLVTADKTPWVLSHPFPSDVEQYPKEEPGKSRPELMAKSLEDNIENLRSQHSSSRDHAEERTAKIVSTYRYQQEEMRSNPRGWLAASIELLIDRPLAIGLAWFISAVVVFACFTAVWLSVVSLVSLPSLVAFHDDFESRLEFPSEWQGIVTRLRDSKDKYEEESLFIGFLEE